MNNSFQSVYRSIRKLVVLQKGIRNKVLQDTNKREKSPSSAACFTYVGIMNTSGHDEVSD